MSERRFVALFFYHRGPSAACRPQPKGSRNEVWDEALPGLFSGRVFNAFLLDGAFDFNAKAQGRKDAKRRRGLKGWGGLSWAGAFETLFLNHREHGEHREFS